MYSRVLALFIGMTVLLSAGKAPGSRAEYIGGTVASIPLRDSGILQTIDQTYCVFLSKQTQIRIPYERINLVEYGQKVNHHLLPAIVISPVFLLAKSREHFLTIGFQDDAGNQQALIFRVEKSDIRAALVSLEARTGQQVQFQDEEARKAGRG
jgi:hypothetical protein